jgi:hypothetical protein
MRYARCGEPEWLYHLKMTTGERRDTETVMRRCVSRKGWRVRQETVLPR